MFFKNTYGAKFFKVEFLTVLRNPVFDLAHCIEVAEGWKKDTPMRHLIKAACSLAPPRRSFSCLFSIAYATHRVLGRVDCYWYFVFWPTKRRCKPG